MIEQERRAVDQGPGQVLAPRAGGSLARRRRPPRSSRRQSGVAASDSTCRSSAFCCVASACRRAVARIAATCRPAGLASDSGGFGVVTDRRNLPRVCLPSAYCCSSVIVSACRRRDCHVGSSISKTARAGLAQSADRRPSRCPGCRRWRRPTAQPSWLKSAVAFGELDRLGLGRIGLRARRPA